MGSVLGFVAKGGNVVYKKAFGWKDVAKQIPATPDGYSGFYDAGRQGLVAVNDPVSKYFPDISD